jgi:SAM-dependent methyltransferase
LGSTETDHPDLSLGSDIHRFELTSRGGATGRLIVAAKRLLRRLLHPVLARQAAFNVAVAGILERDRAEIASMRAELAAYGAELADLRTFCANVQANHHTVLEVADRIGDELGTYSEVTREFEKRLLMLQGGLTGSRLRAPLDSVRGVEQFVREQQRGYVPHFRDHAEVLDLGCGRGEFLELLRDAGIGARGVDHDPELVSRCLARELQVEQADCIAHLADSAPESLGGIFSARLLEQLDPVDVARLIALAGTRLRPGGVLVLETTDPRQLIGLARFWLDPAHVRPVHPELLRWLAEREGFVDVAIESVAGVGGSAPGTDEDAYALLARRSA